MKKIITSIILLFVAVGVTRGQARYQPYSYQFYQKLNEEVYSPQTRFHSALKQYFIDDTVLSRKYDQLMNMGVDTNSKRSWGHRKLFNEHLIDVKTPEYTFFADYLPDLTIGKDFAGNRNVWLNTRGFQLGGTIGKNFYFYSSGFENQARFPTYLNTYINQIGIVPGQAYDRTFGKDNKDWSDVTAIISYTPIKFLNITLGHDRTFIGDGYRSQLLSTDGSAYPFLKLTANIGNVQYMAMWTYMTDPASPQLSYLNGYRRKWGVFHYLDWNVTKRLSFGFFDSVIWADVDAQGNKRGFEWGYASPILFLRPEEASIGSPDNVLIGFTGKYKLSDGITAYGQFALDEFEAKSFFKGDGSSRNKYAWQLGIRGANLFKVKTLNYLVEYNSALPYTYSEQNNNINNYSAQAEPLAHPFGANYREVVALLNYSYKRFDLSGQANYARYGLDENGLNYGKDIFKLYNDPARQSGNYIGQGLTTNMYYLEAKAAYLLNPKYNLRIELGGIFRRESNLQFQDKTTMLTIGLRSSFRKLHYDIASYRAH